MPPAQKGSPSTSTGRTGVKLKAPAPRGCRGGVKVDPTIPIPPTSQYDELLSTLQLVMQFLCKPSRGL